MKPRRNEEAQAHIGLSSHRRRRRERGEKLIILQWLGRNKRIDG
jgi:hypothetical protein